MKTFDERMDDVHIDSKYRWCEADCCCIGAVNCALKLHDADKAEWEDWVHRNPKPTMRNGHAVRENG